MAGVNDYIFTMHRPSNVDNLDKLSNIIIKCQSLKHIVFAQCILELLIKLKIIIY